MSGMPWLAQALAPWLERPHVLLLLALLVAAACIDWRSLRIPNWLTAGGAAAALLLSLAGLWPAQPAPWQALAGLALGLGLMLPWYGLRMMGAGDVKLMAMVGAFLGPLQTLHAALWVFATGALVALAVALARRAGRPLASPLWPLFGAGAQARAPGAASLGKLPYGVSIGLGTALSLGWRLVPL
jgi:prepilin peptidase CpaA